LKGKGERKEKVSGREKGIGVALKDGGLGVDWEAKTTAQAVGGVDCPQGKKVLLEGNTIEAERL